ncbi:DUF192 domain-containing protein [Anaeroselena agilis]|uniref:DUF192 domain-containing protein n=1 Tax=Anaeroselena agilis TaxID=3063788 RepID=A0ABU3P3Q8_9FIRM|nr:DUF192 domain-containing protein [Selenomonadales bacterium 4137-cl]
MEIVNVTTGKLLANDARLADSFFTRLRGLLGTEGLPDGGGLVIRPCCSIHTFGMKYPIDVLFAADGDRVAHTVANLGPGRMTLCRGSRYVIELPPGTLDRTGTKPGDQLRLG